MITDARSVGRCFVVVSPLVFMLPVSVSAVEFDAGPVAGNVDTTVSFGTMSRVQGRDNSAICTANGGTAHDCNADDGNLNYDTGIVSQVWKVISDVEVNHKSGNFGAFFRARGFVDTRNNSSGDTERTPLGDRAQDLVGRHVDLLDAYGWARFDVAGRPAQVRFGKHVLNWGESTFMGGGISAVNPIDAAALRMPGAEIREALLPVNMLSLSMDATDQLSAEAFYQLDWDKTIAEPAGSYFSTNDAASDGGNRVQLGFGDVPDTGFSFEKFGAGLTNAINADLATAINAGLTTKQALFDPDFMMLSRAGDNSARDSGQWGIALRYFSESLNDTEFGFYYMNHHSRMPVVSARTGSADGVNAGATAAGRIIGGANTPAANKQQVANMLAVDRYAKTANYLVEYPEDVGLFGLGFNTDLGKWAFQGEYSFKNNAPLQIDDIELFLATLTPLGEGLKGAGSNSFANNQIGVLGPDQYVKGYIERDISQLQATLSRAFGNTMGANEFLFVGEAAVTHVHGMPSKGTLRLEGPGTFTSGNPSNAALTGGHPGKAAESWDHFADATSWGYRLRGRWTYNSVIHSINLLPHVAFQHDVSGVSPAGGNFVEDRKAVTLGLGATYKSRWETDLSYTSFFGAGRYNLLNDRDYVSFNLKYLF